MATASHWLSFIVFLPLLGVPALLCLRDEDHVWIRRVALVVSLVEFVISLFLLPGFRMGQPDYQFAEYANWIGNAIHYHIGIDGLSLFLVLLTTFLTPLAILCSWTSIHENVKGFFIAILVIETAMIGVFVSLDLFLFFLFWELTLIPMYFMIGIWGHDRRIYAAGHRYLGVSRDALAAATGPDDLNRRLEAAFPEYGGTAMQGLQNFYLFPDQRK